MMRRAWWLDVRDGLGAFWALCDHFAGSAAASFEGDLARFELLSVPGASPLETDALRRQTGSPLLDFAVVPLTVENLGVLKERLSGSRAFGRTGDVVHVQLAQGHDLLFIAGDNFHRKCVSAFDLAPKALLDRLVAEGVIRSYRAAA